LSADPRQRRKTGGSRPLSREINGNTLRRSYLLWRDFYGKRPFARLAVRYQLTPRFITLAGARNGQLLQRRSSSSWGRIRRAALAIIPKRICAFSGAKRGINYTDSPHPFLPSRARDALQDAHRGSKSVNNYYPPR